MYLISVLQQCNYVVMQIIFILRSVKDLRQYFGLLTFVEEVISTILVLNNSWLSKLRYGRKKSELCSHVDIFDNLFPMFFNSTPTPIFNLHSKNSSQQFIYLFSVI